MYCQEAAQGEFPHKTPMAAQPHSLPLCERREKTPGSEVGNAVEQREGREAPNITLVTQNVARNDLSLVPS